MTRRSTLQTLREPVVRAVSNEQDLLREMDAAGVDRCVIVPLEAPGPDQSANNRPAMQIARVVFCASSLLFLPRPSGLDWPLGQRSAKPQL